MLFRSGLACLVMAGNGIWGFVEGIIILAQGDAGLARKGYAVAMPNMGYGQPMNNMNGMSGNNMQQMNNFGGNVMGGAQNGNSSQNNMQNMNNGGRQNGQ